MKQSSNNGIGSLLPLLVLSVFFLLGDKCPDDIRTEPKGAPEVAIQGTAKIGGTHYVNGEYFWRGTGGDRQVKATIKFQPFTNLGLRSGDLEVGERDYLDAAKTAFRRIKERALYDSATQETPLTQVEVLAFKKASVGKVFNLTYVAKGIGGGGEKRSERIKISWPGKPSTRIEAESQQVCEGARVDLDWRVNGVVNEVKINSKRVSGAAVSPSGSLSSGTLDGRETFTLVARGPGGNHSSSVTVTTEKCLDKKTMYLRCVLGCSGGLYSGPVFYEGTYKVPGGWEVDKVKNPSSYYTLGIVGNGDLRAGKSSAHWRGRAGTLKIGAYIKCAPLIGNECPKGVPSSLALGLEIRKR